MATTPRHGKPYIYATWLTRLIAGDEQCAYQPWFKAHFKYDKRDDGRGFDFTAWSIEHQALVERHAAGLRAEGYTVTLEDQNHYKLFGKTAIVACKPDIIAEREGVVVIADAKTGAERNSDVVQVLLYMATLPKIRGDIRQLRGVVVYHDKTVPIARELLTPELETRIYDVIRAAATDAPPDATPSVRGCDFCDIAACQYRLVEETPASMVGEF